MSTRNRAGTDSESTKTWGIDATGRSVAFSLPAPLIRHGFRRIRSSSTAVFITARRNRYAAAIVVSLRPSLRRRWTLPDDSRKSFPPYEGVPFGRVPAGSVNAWAANHHGNWPIHCAGLMLRTSSLRAIGGWGGAPTDDDLVMFAGLSEATGGYFSETTTWLYRQHPEQTIRSTHQQQWSEACRRMALQRAAAVRATGIRVDAATDSTTDPIHVGPPIKASPTT